MLCLVFLRINKEHLQTDINMNKGKINRIRGQGKRGDTAYIMSLVGHGTLFRIYLEKDKKTQEAFEQIY